MIGKTVSLYRIIEKLAPAWQLLPEALGLC
jgi:hypothetical protein